MLCLLLGIRLLDSIPSSTVDELRQAKKYCEGFCAFITGLGEEENPYPVDGGDYHFWWDGWNDSWVGDIQYYQASRKFIKDAEGYRWPNTQ